MLMYLSWTLLYMGYVDQARSRRAEAMEAARSLSHAFTLNSRADYHELYRADDGLIRHRPAARARAYAANAGAWRCILRWSE